jgi:hypothetical protein
VLPPLPRGGRGRFGATNRATRRAMRRSWVASHVRVRRRPAQHDRSRVEIRASGISVSLCYALHAHRFAFRDLKWRRELPFRVRCLLERRHLGVPVSTTHTITGSIICVGAARRVSSVRWNVTYNIVMAWVITIPATAAIAALFCWLARLFG